MVQHFAQLLLESRLRPLGLVVVIEYLEGCCAGGCASGLQGAYVERVTDDWIVGGVNGHPSQKLGIARKNGRKGRINIQASVS